MDLIIVESPSKAKTISKYLKGKYKVDASGGHVRDLPEKTLGVKVTGNFEPKYEITPSKKDVIKRLTAEAAKADSREERDDKDTKTIHKKDADEHVSDTDANERSAFQGEGANAQADVSVSDGAAAAESTPQRSTPYRPVDIRL